MADRLISVPAAKHFVQTVIADPILQATINNILDGLVAVDATPVVHGRWIDVKESDMYVPDMKFTITRTVETCSECKARIGFIGAKQYLFDAVCPNCGAKMDLEVAKNG